MADEQDRTPTDPVEDWAGSDFYGIAVSDEVIRLGVGTEQISAEAARAKVYERILAAQEAAGVNTDTRGGEARALADLIVQSLPADAMHEEVVAAIDLRPYASRFLESDAKTRDQVRALAPDQATDMVGRQAILDGLQAKAQQAVDEQIAQYGLSEAQREEARRSILEFDPASAGRSFEVIALERGGMFGQAAAGGQLPAGSASTNPMSPDWSPTTLVERQAQRTGIPVDELRQLANAGLMDLAGLINEEIQLQSQLNTRDFLPVEVRTMGGPSSAGSANTATTERMSMINAMTYLQTLPESQVADMQKKMAAAGYYNELSTPRGYIEGDAHDDATMEAWNNVIMESIQKNVPITKLVGTRLQGYQERQRAALEQQLLPIDREYLGQAGDMAMQELLGRQMTVAESRELTTYLDALRQERSGYVVAGGDINRGIDGPLRGDFGFDQGDIESKVMQMGQVESAGRQGFDSVQAVWQAFNLDTPDPAEIKAWRQANRPEWMTDEES